MLGDQAEGTFYAEALIGYRTWMMTEGLDLIGVGHPQLWPHVDDATALCTRALTKSKPEVHRPNDVPVKACGCGFYAFWTPEIVRASSFPWQNKLISVRGAAIGWGKMRSAEKGWRAKYARPVALLRWPERRSNVLTPYDDQVHGEKARHWNEISELIAVRYNVALVDSYEALEAAAHDYLAS